MKFTYHKALNSIKAAIKRTIARIQTAETKTDLIDEVMELRSQKRAELVCLRIMEKND